MQSWSSGLAADAVVVCVEVVGIGREDREICERYVAAVEVGWGWRNADGGVVRGRSWHDASGLGPGAAWFGVLDVWSVMEPAAEPLWYVGAAEPGRSVLWSDWFAAVAGGPPSWGPPSWGPGEGWERSHRDT